jgi:hypothetical protein
MRGFLTTIAALALAGGAVASQQTVEIHPGRGGSPHVRTTTMIDGATVAIEYGRPSLKGRPDSQLMPPGEVWRTGADEATTLTTSTALMFGTVHVPAGSVTLYTVPAADGWQLVISKATGQWGIPYPGADQDLARLPMTLSQNASPVEQLTITVEDTDAGGTLHVAWGMARASIAFTVATSN